MADPISFDTAGLTRAGERRWRDGNGDRVCLSVFDMAPDLPVPLEEIAALRAGDAVRYARAGGALVECDPVAVHGLPALWQIVKLRSPDRCRGLVYLGSLLVPRATRSAVLKVQCDERGVTGAREAMVGSEVGPSLFYLYSPFRPGFDPRSVGGLPNHVADGREYDTQFPEHPLTRARVLLARLAATVAVDPGFRTLPPFTGPRDAGRPRVAARGQGAGRSPVPDRRQWAASPRRVPR